MIKRRIIKFRKKRSSKKMYKKYTIYRKPRNINLNKSLIVKRMVSGTTPLTFSTTATTNFWKYNTVSLDSGFLNYSSGTALVNLTNLAEYQALFDQYKLNGYKLTFRPKFFNYNYNQINPTTGTTTTNIPYFCIVKDPMSTITPVGGWSQSTLNTLLEQGGKIIRADRTVSIYIKPKIVEQYGGGANRYISPRFTDLTTVAGVATQHRGFHLFYFNGTWDTASVASNAWDVYITYYLSFKNPK